MLRFTNFKPKTMFLNLTVKDQIEIIACKINEIEMSEMCPKDKKTIKSIYRQKLKKIQPTTKN